MKIKPTSKKHEELLNRVFTDEELNNMSRAEMIDYCVYNWCRYPEDNENMLTSMFSRNFIKRTDKEVKELTFKIRDVIKKL